MTPELIIAIVVPIIVAIIASSGFWAFINKGAEKKGFQTDLLIGMAHDRITYVGMTYIQRGWISQEEYENLHDYLYKPYERLGGNGSARRIMLEIEKLPIRNNVHFQGDIKNGTLK